MNHVRNGKGNQDEEMRDSFGLRLPCLKWTTFCFVYSTVGKGIFGGP